MTLTIKEPTESVSPAKSGAQSPNSDPHRAQSNRANPRCLEVAVTVRSLPGETGAGSGPIREEGKTVIVFDNGAVLRLWNNLPAGQKIILSSGHGNDVVCRVVSGRNLPNVQGYIEVEFMEPFHDFWGLQSGRAGSVAPMAEPVPVMEMPQAAPVSAPAQNSQHTFTQTPAAPPAPTTAPTAPAMPPLGAADRVPRPSGNAPSFDDIAGLLRMSPPPANRPKTHEPAGPSDSRRNKNDFAPHHEIARSSAMETTVPIADAMPMKRPVAPPQEYAQAPARTPSFSNDLDSRATLNSMAASSVASSSKTGSRIGLMIGGLALVLVGFGAGYVFMHQGSSPAPAAAAATATQSATLAPAPPTIAYEATPASPEPAADRTATERPAAPVAVSSERETEKPAALTESSNARPSVENAAKTGQLEQQAKQRQQLANLNLKMSVPTEPKKSAANLSATQLPDVENLTSASGTPSANLSSVVRSSNQPTPPPPAPNRVVREAKLISATKPVYPPAVRDMNVQGSVTVSASIDVNGAVTAAKAISGPTALRQAAVDAVRQWKYSPGTIDAKPVASQVTVDVQFRLK